MKTITAKNLYDLQKKITKSGSTVIGGVIIHNGIYNVVVK